MSPHKPEVVQLNEILGPRGLTAYHNGSVKIAARSETGHVLFEFPDWAAALEYFRSQPTPSSARRK